MGIKQNGMLGFSIYNPRLMLNGRVAARWVEIFDNFYKILCMVFLFLFFWGVLIKKKEEWWEHVLINELINCFINQYCYENSNYCFIELCKKYPNENAVVVLYIVLSYQVSFHPSFRWLCYSLVSFDHLLFILSLCTLYIFFNRFVRSFLILKSNQFILWFLLSSSLLSFLMLLFRFILLSFFFCLYLFSMAGLVLFVLMLLFSLYIICYVILSFSPIIFLYLFLFVILKFFLNLYHSIISLSVLLYVIHFYPVISLSNRSLYSFFFSYIISSFSMYLFVILRLLFYVHYSI